jgi:hypothetical protein
MVEEVKEVEEVREVERTGVPWARQLTGSSFSSNTIAWQAVLPNEE